MLCTLLVPLLCIPFLVIARLDNPRFRFASLAIRYDPSLTPAPHVESQGKLEGRVGPLASNGWGV